MNTQKSGRLWWTLLAAPFLALVLIVLASVYFGFVTQGKDPAAIPQLVADSTPYQLVALQIWILLRPDENHEARRSLMERHRLETARRSTTLA